MIIKKHVKSFLIKTNLINVIRFILIHLNPRLRKVNKVYKNQFFDLKKHLPKKLKNQQEKIEIK